MIIKNFEVDYEEEDPDVKMSGGLRGIQALRVQREYIPDIDYNEGVNRFHKYESAPAEKNPLEFEENKWFKTN